MVFFNYALRKLNAKIVYYGPGLCGKTTNLQWIHDHFDGGSRGKMISLATEGDRTIFFDLLPLDIGTIRGMEVTLQLYTVPGQVHYNSTRQLVLRGADGVVFVADSQRTMKSSNIESLKNLEENLRLQGIELKDFPHVLQFNKRDLRDLLTVEDLDADLNLYTCPFFEGVATDGIGVQETLEGIVKLVMRKLRDRYEPAGKGAGRAVAAAPAPAAGGPKPMAPSGPQPMAPPQAPPATKPSTPAASAPEPTEPELPAAAAKPPDVDLPPVADEAADVVAYDEHPAEDVDQDNVTTATFDEAMAEEGAPRSAPSRPSVDDLLAEATGASTIRVEDTADLDAWREQAGLDEAEGPAPSRDAQSEPESFELAAEELSLADARTDTGILFPPDEEAVPEPSSAEEETGPAFAVEDPGPAFADSDPGPAFARAEPAQPASPPDGGAEFPKWEGEADLVESPDFDLSEEEGFATQGPPDLVGDEATASGAGSESPFGESSRDVDFVDEVRAPSPFARPTAGAGGSDAAAEQNEGEPFAAAPEPEPVFEEPEPDEPEIVIEREPAPVEQVPMMEVTPARSPFGEAEEAALEAAAEAVVEPVVEEREDEAPPPSARRADEAVVFGGDEDPFGDPFAIGDEEGPAAKVAPPPAVTVMPAEPSKPVRVGHGDNKLSLRLQGTGAIAEAGQVRELEIQVPVPGAWVGNQSVTLQLRLTLVPSQEDEDGS